MFWVAWIVLIIAMFVYLPLVAIGMVAGTILGILLSVLFAIEEVVTKPVKARRLAHMQEERHRKNGSRLNNGRAEWWDTNDQKWKPYAD